MDRVLLLYIGFGAALLGASHNWSHRGWAFYSVFFPLHALCLALAKDLWPFVKAIVTNQTLHKILVFVITVYILWLFSSQ